LPTSRGQPQRFLPSTPFTPALKPVKTGLRATWYTCTTQAARLPCTRGSGPNKKKTSRLQPEGLQVLTRVRCQSLHLFSESGSHSQPLAARHKAGHFYVSACKTPLTNPLDALLLPRVLRWVAVVFRQKSKCGYLDAQGRPWTRLPAKDLVEQLEEEDQLSVSTRTVQRSLERLVEAGYLTRLQRTKWWGQRDYWYSWTDDEWELHQHRPTAASRRSPAAVTLQREPSCRPEASALTVQGSTSSSSSTQSSKSNPTAEQKVASPLDGAGVCAGRQRASGGQVTQRSAKASKGVLQGLAGVVQRATARGFGGSSQPDTPLRQAETWIDAGFRFTRLPSGHLVKDSLTTAPLR